MIEINDPLEPVNRIMYHVNDTLYFWVLKPCIETVELVVDLGTGGAAEGVAGRAAGRALDLLDARRPLVLVTLEYSGVKRVAVRTTDDVARRLAMAVEGPVARPDHPHEFIGPVVPR